MENHNDTAEQESGANEEHHGAPSSGTDIDMESAMEHGEGGEPGDFIQRDEAPVAKDDGGAPPAAAASDAPAGHGSASVSRSSSIAALEGTAAEVHLPAPRPIELSDDNGTAPAAEAEGITNLLQQEKEPPAVAAEDADSGEYHHHEERRAQAFDESNGNGNVNGVGFARMTTLEAVERIVAPASELEPPPGPPALPEALSLTNNSSSSGAAADDNDWPPYCDPSYRMPSLLHIHVEGDAQNGFCDADFEVKIEKDKDGGGGSIKPFLGGFRHRSTRKAYHHAATQFGVAVRKAVRDTSHLRSRDTQTCVTQHRGAQNARREAGTKMERPGITLAESFAEEPVCLTPRPYEDAHAFWKRRVAALVLLQRSWRGHAGRARVAAIKDTLQRRRLREEEAAAAAAAAGAAAAEKAAERRLHPRSMKDFEALYTELEGWKAAELRRIAADDRLSEDREARTAATALLAAREAKMLQTIGRMKARAAAAASAGRADRELAMMAAPKRWELADGEVAEVHTPWTERAAELRALHQALEARFMPIEERLDVLLHVKWTVREFDCVLTRDLCELLDREADLLRRGRTEKSLEALRRRIRTLFLRFVATPDFNPEATRFSTVPPRYQHLLEDSTRSLDDRWKPAWPAAAIAAAAGGSGAAAARGLAAGAFAVPV